MAEAHALAAEADLMLCIGSSLEVYPVASLPELTRERAAALALVTQGPTPTTARPRSSSTATWSTSCGAVLAALRSDEHRSACIR